MLIKAACGIILKLNLYHCNPFKERAPVDEIYGCLFFKWVVETWGHYTWKNSLFIEAGDDSVFLCFLCSGTISCVYLVFHYKQMNIHQCIQCILWLANILITGKYMNSMVLHDFNFVAVLSVHGPWATNLCDVCHQDVLKHNVRYCSILYIWTPRAQTWFNFNPIMDK